MIDKIPHHYSFENLPTVYDEEALTALELCGKLGKKVNEVITAVNGWNVPNIVYVSPTGDKTGKFDRATIQGKLDAGYAVELAAGEYYLDGPLFFRSGYMLRGNSQLKTVLNCSAGFIDHENTVSVDHVEVRDVRVKGPGSGVGIDISRKVQGIETGGRYAHFMNVYIDNYGTAVRLGGCWCTNFTHCRIEATEICVEQRGSCNHVRYDHCMFLGPVDAKTTTGVKITAEDGAENYGISFDHCEFERHDTAIHAYYCLALNVTGVYVEGVKTVFKLDSCPGFLCDGGYISYPERVCNTARTNTSKVFSKCTGEIRSLYVRVNYSAEPFYLTSTTQAFPLKIERVDCVNDGTAVCYSDAQVANSIFNGAWLCPRFAKFINKCRPVAGNNYHFIEAYPEYKYFKLMQAKIRPMAQLTLEAPATYKVKMNTSKRDYDMIITIPAGTHAAWSTFNATVHPDIASNYAELIYNFPDNTGYAINLIAPTDIGVDLEVTLGGSFGNFIL